MTNERSTRLVRTSITSAFETALAWPTRLGRLQAERAGEDRQAAQHRSIVRTQEIVAPRDGGFERLVAQWCGSASPDQQVEPVVEALDELIEAKGSEADGRKLDGQGDPVEAACQLDHGGLVVRGHLEGCASLSRALDEQGDGLRLRDPLRRQLSNVFRYR